MIPIQLKIEGLYSYQERQKIDFTKLTEAGLFGIFGSVGSGKSSILEAITFALYGETERLNARDKRAYNMMNLKSNRSYIEFDFMNFENKKFRATREFKRNSKNFEDVKSPNVIFYEWKNENWIPLERPNAEEIIGLSYANFKRTIIIPQGQFKEFIELGATERTNMMKEIFDLYRFDLQQNVSTLNIKNRSDLDQLEGQLKGFEEVNETQIQLQKENLTLEKEKFKEVEIEFRKIDKKYQLLKNLKADFEILTQKKSVFKKLDEKKESFAVLEAKTDLYDQTFRIFNPLLLEKKKLRKEITSQKRDQENEARILSEIETHFNILKDELKTIQPKYDALNESKIKENDLSLILQMLKFSEEIKMLKERTKLGSKKVIEVDANQKITLEKIKEFSAQAESLKPQKLDSNLLFNIGNWFAENKKLVESDQIQIKKIAELNLKISNISHELKPFEIDIETFNEDFKAKNDLLEIQKKLFSEKRNQLEVQQKLAHFADELHDGKSCPLCGSLEHPSILTFDDLHSNLNTILKKIEITENQQKENQKQTTEIEKILARKKFFEEQMKAEQETLKQITIQFENHQKSFIWKGFNANQESEFEQKRQQSFAIEKQLEAIGKNLNEEQKTLEKERENLDKFNKALADLKLDEGKKETQIKTNLSNLKVLNWTNYQQENFDKVEESYLNLTKSNLETEQIYQHLIAKEKELSPKLAVQKTNVKNSQKRISELDEEISENENFLNESLSEQNFTSLAEVEIILVHAINIQETRKEIEKFRIEFETLKNSINEFTLKLKDFRFEEEEFSAAENQFKTSEIALKNANDTVVKTSSEIERLEKEFNKKENLIKELAKLQKRAENLKVMTNLFKGAGFVQFVSSIYLRQLCDHANIRFHRMTRNQLSLQLNDNNDFEIIDYLNEGKCRSVKTLSGGQSFQVSLSLALALAESVQQNAKAEKNFFFIDEGFGTQDLESVNVVFETLTNLQKENRIVGIISHVEELKEKMPISLNITKDDERGSLIEVM